jgi:hypothetical protein
VGRGGGHRRGKPLSSATRAKISKALTGKKHPHKGHAMSAAAKAKLSAARKGKKHPHKAHPLSAATKAKLAAARKGKKHPHKGHAMSTEARAKLSAALRQRAKLRAAEKVAQHRKKQASIAPKRRGASIARQLRTKKFHSGPYRLLSTRIKHVRKGLIHGQRRHYSRIVIHRAVRTHHVWRRRRKSR